SSSYLALASPFVDNTSRSISGAASLASSMPTPYSRDPTHVPMAGPFESPDGSVGPGNVRPSCNPSPNVRGAHGDVAQRRRVTPTISVYLPSCPRSSTSSLFQTEVHSCRYPHGGLTR